MVSEQGNEGAADIDVDEMSREVSSVAAHLQVRQTAKRSPCCHCAHLPCASGKRVNARCLHVRLQRQAARGHVAFL